MEIRECTRRFIIAAAALLAVFWWTAAVYAQISPQDIKALQDQAIREGWTFTLSENSASSRTLEQLTGYIPPTEPITTLPARRTPDKIDLPPSFMAGPLPSIRDQGNCGSCWAFATIGAVEGTMCYKGYANPKYINLSEQHIIDCNTFNWGCNGGWEAYYWLKDWPDKCHRTGAVLESDIPYQADDGFPCDCAAPRKYWLYDWGYVDGYNGSVPSIEDLKYAIMTYGPVSVAVQVNMSFILYDDGVFDACYDGPYNHMVVVYGWDDNQGTDGIWYLRNSWGQGWGENGTMRIEYGCCGIGYNACYVDYRGNIDSDADGYLNLYDNCVHVANPDQTDTDADSFGDACDNCPTTYNFEQYDADHDNIGDVCDNCTDTDHDGYGNPGYPANTCPTDNCPLTYNPNQADSDGDGIGNSCDNCPTVYNPDQGNFDGDYPGDVCDNCPYVANSNQTNADGDEFGDACEVAADWQASMDKFPDQVCPAWTLANSADVETPVFAGDTLVLTTSTELENMYYQQEAPVFAYPAEGLSVEFRMKYVSGTTGAPEKTPCAVWFIESPGGNILWIGQDEIFLWSGWGVKGESVVRETDDKYHAYRIEVTEAGAISVYYDYSLALTGTTFSYAGWTNAKIGWGDESDAAFGTSRWTYFRHNGYVNDVDTDADGVIDVCDNCPTVKNTNQADGDADGVGNLCDNCPSVSNPDQANADGDGLGDVCDPCPYDPNNDQDGDGLCADVDNCPLVSNPDQTDTDGDGQGDACDPLYVPTQYATIQAAIDVIGPGGTVMVEPGTYTGTGNHDISFRGKAITVTSSAGPLETIIDCQNLGRGFVFENAETLSSRLSGLTIKNGTVSGGYGGGILVSDTEISMMIIASSPTIDNCLIYSCTAGYGGGIYVIMGSKTVIENCTIVKNTATRGAGIYYQRSTSQTHLNRSIIAYNNGEGVRDGGITKGTLAYQCNIFWQNTGGNVVNINGAGINNRTVDPKFCDYAGNDFKLSVYSPCIAFRSPCNVLTGAIDEFCETPFAHRGDVNLNYVSWDIGDFIVFNNWFEIGDSAYLYDVEAQRKASDFTCDGFMQTMADFLHWSLYEVGHECPGLEPLFSPQDTIKVLDTSAAKGTIRQGIDLYLANSDLLSGLQARITYNVRLLTPHFDTALGGGAVEYERLNRLTAGTPNFSDGDVTVMCKKAGEIWVYLSVSDALEPDIYINSGSGRFLRIFFDVKDEEFVPPSCPMIPQDQEYRINMLAQYQAQTIIPRLVAGTFSLPPENPSCPVLFAFDGTDYVQENPLLTACEQNGYAEAVDDYYLVNSRVASKDGMVRFQLRELEDEITYLNGLELITVDHSPYTRVASDADGRIATFERTVAPLSAIDDQGVDRLAEIADEDGVYFSSDGAGYLELTYPRTDDDFGIDLGSEKKDECLEEPIGFPKVADSKSLLNRGLTVECQDIGGSWVTFSKMPARVVQTNQYVFLPRMSGNAEQVTIRVSWDRAYTTDAIRQFILSSEAPVIGRHAASQAALKPGGAGQTPVKIGGSQPVQLRQGDILDVAFAAGPLPGTGMTRSYIVKATGRYVPTFLSGDALPKNFVLNNNYPNPFNPVTTIGFALPMASEVRLEIFNILGQRVTTLINGQCDAGYHQVIWDGKDGGGHAVASGMYMYRLTAGSFTETKKMVLLK